MKQSILHKRIPNIAGFFMLLVTVFMTSFLVRSGVLFPIQATVNEQPNNVQVTNITDTSFTIVYNTVDATTGTITYGTTDTYGTVATDIRDLNDPQPHILHYITVGNLQPKTTYKFAILSGASTYTNNGLAYSVTTGSSLPQGTIAQKTLSGKVVLLDGSTPKESVVLLKNSGTQMISTLVDSSGNYLIPLDTLRSADLSNYALISDTTQLDIAVLGENLHSSVSVVASQPIVPPITLSQSYDFTTTPETNDASQSAVPTGVGNTFPIFSINKPVNANPQILTPKKDEAFTDLQPQFSGIAPPNRSVDITLKSTDELKASVKTNAAGAWDYRPAKPLTPGNYTITIASRDEAGIFRTASQSFIVNAEGSQFTEPSISPTKPKATPTGAQVSPTSAPTIQQISLPPTAAVTPTDAQSVPSPSLVPTYVTIPTATPTIIYLITAPPTQPLQPPPSEPPGSEGLFITVGLAAIAVIGGSVLFFLTLGGL